MTAMTDQASALRGLVRRYEQADAASGTPGVVDSRRARVIAVASGKKGVGKTCMAINLAINISARGKRVVFLDADLGTANADLLCNLSPNGTIAHVIAGERTLQQVILNAPGGFRLVPGAHELARIADLDEVQRFRLINQLLSLERDADLILIDTGAGVGANVLSFAEAADQLFVVTTPEPTAILDAYALMKTVTYRCRNVDTRIAVNMVHTPDEGKEVFDRIQAVCRSFLSMTPHYVGHMLADPLVALAVRRRVPFMFSEPGSAASQCVDQLAKQFETSTCKLRGNGMVSRLIS